MAKITPYNQNEPNRKKVEPVKSVYFKQEAFDSKLYSRQPRDTFEFRQIYLEDIIEPVSYPIQDVIKLVGKKRTDEIFETFLSDNGNGSTGKISPPTGEDSLIESLSTIWGKNKLTEEEKEAKLFELSRTKRAFLILEKEASKKLEEQTGKKTNIKIAVQTDDKEAFLTDILDEQISFYKKNDVAASADLIGQRIGHKFSSFIDKLTKK